MMFHTFHWTMELVLSTKNLQKLSLYLNFDHSALRVDPISSANTLPGLQELKLSCTYVTVEILSKLLLHFRDTLRALSFRHVTIESGSCLISVSKRLRSDFPLLESIYVFHLKQFDGKIAIASCSPRFLRTRPCLGHRVGGSTWFRRDFGAN